MSVLNTLRRHPFVLDAWFEYSLVLTFAYPRAVLEPLLPPGLVLDTYEDYGFLAIALVQVRELRPAGLPAALGQRFFLSGYRLFTRYHTSRGKRLRGLFILRSDTNQRRMAWLGGLTSHYQFEHAQLISHVSPNEISLRLRTPAHHADLDLTAHLSGPAPLPPTSPFPDWATARRFAGPLPFTFSPDADGRSMLLVEGQRENWTPQPVAVTLREATFLHQPPFDTEPACLANAFLIRDIPYRWRRGVLDLIPEPMLALSAL